MKKNTDKLIYKVAFNTAGNFFIAYDARNQARTAQGITIEQAIANLKQTA